MAPGDANSLQWLCDRVNLAKVHADRVGVLIAANIQGRTTPIDDYDGDSIITEFLTSSELDCLLEGFAESGIYTEVVLDEQGFLDWTKNGRERFPRSCIFVYNLAQNGTGAARLSLVPSLCRIYRLPLLDSDVYAVTLSRHKFHSGAILHRFGLPAARSWIYGAGGWLSEPPPDDLKLIIKPTFESASIGIHNDSVLEMSARIAGQLDMLLRTYHQPLTIQEFVEGFEVEVPVFEGDKPQTIAAVGIALNNARNLGSLFLTYDSVARDAYEFYDFASESKFLADQVMAIARKAFQCLGLAGVGRIDFRISPQGAPVIIEVACKPHLTAHSSFGWLMRSVQLPYSDLLKFLVGSALQRNNILADS